MAAFNQSESNHEAEEIPTGLSDADVEDMLNVLG